MMDKLKIALGILKIFLGGMAVFLIVCGIHWIAILTGVILGAIYFALPKSLLN